MSYNPKNQAENKKRKHHRKRTNFLPLLAVVTVAICIVVVFVVNQKGTLNESIDISREIKEADVVTYGETQNENDGAEHEISGGTTIAVGEDLVISLADITTDASFFSVKVGDTDMEVIAVKDSSGNIRTAFNTCQVCYDSGRGYYVQSGNYLVCQNCGNRFSMDQVEVESGGCNPWPIFTENKTVTVDELSISYDFLVEAQGIFENWKGSY